MSSILDEYKQITVEKFEGAIATGRSMHQICTMFQKTTKEMDDWCKENYNGANFSYVYEVIKQLTLNEYFETMKELGYRGNPSAMAIINTAIQNLDSNNTLRIVFENGGVQEETEDDKLNEQ